MTKKPARKPSLSTEPGDRLLTPKQTQQKLSISRATYWRMVKRGQLPQPIYLGDSRRSPRQSLKALDAFIEERTLAAVANP